MKGMGSAAAPNHVHSAPPTTLHITVNGKQVHSPARNCSLLEWLRQEARVKSCKLSCGEGGCGACAVLISNPKAQGASSRVCSVNACLVPVFAMDGWSVTTAEGLPRNAQGQNPIAERLAGFYASQCGFCTPGMAVACQAALTKAAQAGKQPTVHTMRSSIDGNLCRCTGYRPIVDAVTSFAEGTDLEDLGYNIFSCQGQPLPMAAEAPHPTATLLPASKTAAKAAATASVAITAPCSNEADMPALQIMQLSGGQLLYVPYTMKQLLQVTSQQSSRPQAFRLVAGNTAAGVYKDLWPVNPTLIHTLQVFELQGISMSHVGERSTVCIGAAATLADAIDTFHTWVAQAEPTKTFPDGLKEGEEHDVLKVPQCWRELSAHLQRIAGNHVRGAATLAGNLVLAARRGLPSDVATLMLAAGAHVEVIDLSSATPSRHIMPLTDYLNTQQGPGAFYSTERWLLAYVHIPVPQAGSVFWSSRVAVRYVNAAATINAAGMIAPHSAAAQQPPTFVLGMNLAHAPGPEQWCVAHCTAVEHALQRLQLQQAQHWSDAVTVCTSVLPELRNDLSTLFDIHAADVRASHNHTADITDAADGVMSGVTSGVTSSVAQGVTSDRQQQLQQDTRSASTYESGQQHDQQELHDQGDRQEQQQHEEYLFSAAEGLLLQALTALCPSQGNLSNGHAVQSDKAHAVPSQSQQPAMTPEPAARTLSTVAAAESSGKELAPEPSPVTSTHTTLENGAVHTSWARLGAVKWGVPSVGGGTQDLLEPDPQYLPLTQGLPKESALILAEGTAQFSDDMPVFEGSLYAAWVTSTVAKGRVKHIDTTNAMRVSGAVRFVGPQDVPVKPSTAEQPLFAGHVTFHGEPLGLMLATSYQAAQQAAAKVHVQYEAPDQPAVLTPHHALQQRAWYDLPALAPFYKPGDAPGSARVGEADVSAHINSAPQQLRGIRVHLPSQAHMYMENQTAVAELDEDGRIRVHASTQNYDRCLRTVATILGLPHHKVEIKCRRLGGAFGGKANNSHRIAAATAVAALVTGEQVRLSTNCNTDLRMFAGRAAVDVSFDVGFDEDGHILALDMDCVLQGGAYSNLAEFDPHAMTTVIDNAYAIPHLKAQYRLLKLNIAPRTMVRAPGDFPGILVIESVVEAVAAHLTLPPHIVRERNMRPTPPPGTEQLFNSLGRPLGTPHHYSLPRIWKELKQQVKFDERVLEVAAFNASNMWRKRGLSLTPCAYPLPMGARSALVHIYKDGSVLVAHPGVDMGQGLTIKVLQTAAYELGQVLPASQRPLPVSFIRAADPSTYTLPHNGVTAASTTSDVACAAVQNACAELVSRLKPHAEQFGQDFTWQQLIKAVAPMPDLPAKINLTASADGDLSKQLVSTPPPGTMYVMTVYGAAVAEAEIDVLTGDRRVISVDILFDCGRSLNPGIDLGQIEGAFVFGMGMLLGEHTEHDTSTGQCTTDSTWTYKIPGVMCVPERFNVTMLKDSPLLLKGPLSAKAVGEPPLLLSSSVHFALAAATKAAAQQVYGRTLTAANTLAMPATPQAIKLACGTARLEEVIQQHAVKRS